MQRAAAQAMYEALHEAEPYHDGTFTKWVKRRSRLFPFHFMDGVQILVTPEDVNPDDEFTTDRNASPSVHEVEEDPARQDDEQQRGE